MPEKLVQDARESNVLTLTDEKIAELIQAELDKRAERQKHLRVFLDIADQLAAVEPKLTPE